jgi:hypothetical protein
MMKVKSDIEKSERAREVEGDRRRKIFYLELKLDFFIPVPTYVQAHIILMLRARERERAMRTKFNSGGFH